MKHALPLAVRLYAWPSIQRDSQILAQHVAVGLREKFMRERLERYFKRAAA